MGAGEARRRMIHKHLTLTPKEEAAQPLERGAILSDCGTYRYRLWRIWDRDKPQGAFVLLNPSSADALHDDNTTRACTRIFKDMGFGGYAIVNLFAFRSTDPVGLSRAEDPVGPDNERHLLDMARIGGTVVAGWGARAWLRGGNRGTWKRFRNRDKQVYELMRDNGVALQCLAVTRSGQPQHPLFVPTGLPLVSWSPPP